MTPKGPHTDPLPATRVETANGWARYRRLMWWMAFVSLAAVAIALAWLRHATGPLPIAMVIATVAGVGGTVLLGTALMGLVFLSAGIGHDEAVDRTAAELNEERDVYR